MSAASLSTLLATGLGAGYSPVAPGTAGSAVGLLAFLLLPRRAVLLATLVLFFLGVVTAARVVAATGLKDPGIVVIDEVVGMWVALAFLPLTAVTAALAFLFFRAFDVWKPYPARDLEALPGGWGIMADDVMAGLYANLLVRVWLLVLG